MTYAESSMANFVVTLVTIILVALAMLSLMGRIGPPPVGRHGRRRDSGVDHRSFDRAQSLKPPSR